MEADNFIYVHQGIIQLISAMYLSLILKRFFIHVPHKVVDTLVVVNEEEILKLSLPIYRDDDFFLDNDFTQFDWGKLINDSDFQLVAQQKDVQVPFNVVVAEELVSHYIHFIVVYLFFSDCAIFVSETDRHDIFLSNL